MIECSACLRRCISALISAHPTPPTSAFSQRAATRISLSRIHNSARRPQTGLRPRIADEQETRGFPPLAPEEEEEQYSLQHYPAPDAPKRWGQLEGKRRSMEVANAVRGTSPKRLEIRNLHTELKYLRDPLKLAEHIKHVLQANDEEKAQALVRLSSKAIANTVSWNHVIDWQMKHGKVSAALTTYNEMKKRAQRPDNITYILLLRGLAEYAHYPGSLGRALSLYHGLIGPNSKLNPNIAHVNAVLKVCARANDTESLWDIVSKLPERGPRAADSWTFSTLFNHMRYQALSDTKAHDQSENEKREVTVIKARQLWGVIVARWRAGDLKIDEELVGAMGRLLLVGSRPRDWDDVLSLVAQTTQVPRLLPRLGSAALASPEAIDSDHKLERPSRPMLKETASAGSEFDPIPTVSEIQPIGTSVPRKQGFAGFTTHVQPGRIILSLVVDACAMLSSKAGASNYWNLLTDNNSYDVVPDHGNIHSFLRVFRAFRSSNEAAELVCEHMPMWKLRPNGTTFKLAMRTCLRNHQSPQAIPSAGMLLQTMQKTLPEPDVEALSIYVELIGTSKDTSHMQDAAARLEPSINLIRSWLNFGPVGATSSLQPTDKPRNRTSPSPGDKETAVELMQRVISLYDKLLRPDAGLEFGKRQSILEQKARLAAFVTRYRNRWLERDIDKRRWTPADKGKKWTKSTAADSDDGAEGPRVEENGKDGDAVVDSAIPEKPYANPRPSAEEVARSVNERNTGVRHVKLATPPVRDGSAERAFGRRRQVFGQWRLNKIQQDQERPAE